MDIVHQRPDEPRARDVLDDAAVRGWAYRCAERGYHVFPTRPDSKEPRRGLSWPQVACCDLGRLARATWQPGENYAVACKPSGLVVVDLDRPKPGYVLPPRWADEPGVVDGRDVLAVLAERAGAGWPHTFTVSTPSGGAHLYYTTLPGRAIGNKPLGPMIDIRGGGDGNGGYVLGPGSVLDAGRYVVADDQDPQPLPAWIADLLDPPAGARIPRAGSAARVPVPGHGARGRLVGLVAAVLDAQPGERNNKLHWAACRAAEMVGAGQLTEDQVHDSLGQAAARAGLDDGEAQRTIASALRQSLRRTA